MASETESVVKSHSHFPLTGFIQGKVHPVVYLRILMLKIDGGRHRRRIDRVYAGQSLDSTRRSQQMPVHRFCRTYTQFISMFSEDSTDSSQLSDIS